MGICVEIKSIEIIDNIILRKNADMKVELILELVIIKLVKD